MKVGSKHYRSIWLAADGRRVQIIDQTMLPHEFKIVDLAKLQDAAVAIKDMLVRGAPLIGATAAYGVALQMAEDSSDQSVLKAYDVLIATRPTAVNLRWALDEMRQTLLPLPAGERIGAAYRRAGEIADEDVEIHRRIGTHGLAIIEKIAAGKAPGEPVNILTHCNAGWLAAVDWGPATSSIYQAATHGIDLHVWVDETRPRNQGAHLTAWEMAQAGIPHTLIVDNAGGHLMQHGKVDLCIVGTDRVTAQGDVCNKIGTYLKALAAFDNKIPFYVAVPSSTIDWTINDGLSEIPIEERGGQEVSEVWGRTRSGELTHVRISPEGTPHGNPAFDVTPARLVTGLITERGVTSASQAGLAALFRERAT